MIPQVEHLLRDLLPDLRIIIPRPLSYISPRLRSLGENFSVEMRRPGSVVEDAVVGNEGADPDDSSGSDVDHVVLCAPDC